MGCGRFDFGGLDGLGFDEVLQFVDRVVITEPIETIITFLVLTR
jgi:hypothetical protein